MSRGRWILVAVLILVVSVALSVTIWATIECMGQPERAHMDFLVRLVDCS